MNNIRRVILSAFALIIAFGASAQNYDDKVVVKAMEEELQRNMNGLKLPRSRTPFYMSYTIGASESVQIVASYGAIKSVSEQPYTKNTANVQLMVGDYKRNSETNYGSPLMAGGIAKEMDGDAVKRSYWTLSDNAYKTSLGHYAQKSNYLMQNPPTGEFAELDDMQKLPAVTAIEESVKLDINIDQWKENIRKLSAIFKDYKDIDDSNVSFNISTYNVFRVTSEGVKIVTPHTVMSITAEALSTTPEGESKGDRMQIFSTSIKDLPNMEEITKRINTFAKGLTDYVSSEHLAKRYGGPVLFTDGAVLAILNNKMMGGNGLVASRPQVGRQLSGDAFARRIDERVIDSKISIINYSDLESYNGKKLVGSYSIDADGVTPPPAITLVENGIVRALLNGRTPTLGAEKSTGSARWSVNARYADFVTAPGTVHYKVTKATNEKSMKKALIKLAKKEKKDFAYIVKSISGNAKVYRVDVKTGEETLVRGAKVGDISLDKLRSISAISNNEVVANTMTGNGTLVSYIYPKSLLLEYVEIVKQGDVRAKQVHLKSPLKR